MGNKAANAASGMPANVAGNNHVNVAFTGDWEALLNKFVQIVRALYEFDFENETRYKLAKKAIAELIKQWFDTAEDFLVIDGLPFGISEVLMMILKGGMIDAWEVSLAGSIVEVALPIAKAVRDFSIFGWHPFGASSVLDNLDGDVAPIIHKIESQALAIKMDEAKRIENHDKRKARMAELEDILAKRQKEYEREEMEKKQRRHDELTEFAKTHNVDSKTLNQWLKAEGIPPF